MKMSAAPGGLTWHREVFSLEDRAGCSIKSSPSPGPVWFSSLVLYLFLRTSFWGRDSGKAP